MSEGNGNSDGSEIKLEKNIMIPTLTIKQKELIAQDYEEIKRKYPHSFWKVLAEKYSSLWNVSINRETLRCQMKYYMDRKKPDGSNGTNTEGNKLIGMASFESLDGFSINPLNSSRKLSRSASSSNFSSSNSSSILTPEKICGILTAEYPELKDHLNFLYEEKIDLEAFLDLEDSHLKEFGIKPYGIRHRILRFKRLFSGTHPSLSQSINSPSNTPQKRKKSKNKENTSVEDEDETNNLDEESNVQVDEEERTELEQRPDSESLDIDKDRFLTDETLEPQTKKIKLDIGEPIIN